MEIEKIINGLKTAKDKIEKEINFLQMEVNLLYRNLNIFSVILRKSS